ncbi:MAG: methyltransferase domain-containing protein [Spirochaetes bacterium]|nr:MAG: methyltransferase domain-containing protein [Spirochaetota bacterium]
MKFYDRQFALDYDRRLSAEGYPGNLLDEVASRIKGAGRIIDVGAGTGFFTAPLARIGHRVEAVEPSQWMAALLEEKLEGEARGRVRVSVVPWEDWSGDRADALVCVHAIYPMKDTRAALRKMSEYAAKSVLLVKSDVGTLSLAELLRARFGGGHGGSGVFRTQVTDALDVIGLDYEVHNVEQIRVTRIADLDEESEYFRRHLGLEEGMGPEVRRVLEEVCARDKQGYSFRGVYHDVVITF